MPPSWDKDRLIEEGLLGAGIEVVVQHGPFKRMVVLRALDLRRLGAFDCHPGSANNILVVGFGLLRTKTFHFFLQHSLLI